MRTHDPHPPIWALREETRTIRWPLVMGRYGAAPGEKRGNWQPAADLITPMAVRVAATLRVAAVIA